MAASIISQSKTQPVIQVRTTLRPIHPTTLHASNGTIATFTTDTFLAHTLAVPTAIGTFDEFEAMPTAPVITIDTFVLDAFVRRAFLVSTASIAFRLEREALMLGMRRVVNALAVKALPCRALARVLARPTFGRLGEALLLRRGGIVDALVFMASSCEAFVMLLAFLTLLLEALIL